MTRSADGHLVLRDRSGHDLLFCDFFAWRVPLLSLEEFEAGVDGRSERGSAAHEDLLFREGLRLASRELLGLLDDPSHRASGAVDEARLRYFIRAANRPTPFGLFGAWSSGTGGTRTTLELAEREASTRHTRLDAAVLEGILREIRRDGPPLHARTYHANPTVYPAHERLRYVVPTEDGGYESSSVARHELVERVLGACAEPRAAPAIVQLLRADGLEGPAAHDLLAELVDAGLLLDDYEPPLTTLEPTAAIADVLSAQAPRSPLVDPLRRLDRRVHALDQTLVPDDADYEALDDTIAELLTAPSPRGPVHVDVLRPSRRATLDRRILGTMVDAVEAMRRLGAPARPSAIEMFTERFVTRFGDDEIPLVRAVDEEDGVGLAAVHRPDQLHPLAGGLDRPPPVTPVTWSEREHRLVRLLEAADRGGDHEIVVEDDDLAACPAPAPLPSSFAFHGALLADPERLDRHPVWLVCECWSGPPATRTLGRVAHLSPSLRTGVASLLQHEQRALHPAVVVDIVHRPLHPEGMANVARRPSLLDHEIDCLGPASRPVGLPLSDLLLSMRDGRLTLRSRRLDRVVVPRMSAAHNFTQPWHLPAYRLLCSLQYAEGSGSQHWTWDPFTERRHFPRVRYRKAILSPAQWRFTPAELRSLLAGDDARLREQVRAWQDRWRLPRWITVDDLAVDLEVPAVVRAAFGGATSRSVRVAEHLPRLLGTPSRGPEGRYLHELVVPFVRRTARPAPAPSPAPRSSADAVQPPGSRWLHVNIFTGGQTQDALLVGPLGEALDAMPPEHLQGFFFLRQATPDRHLRLRLRGDPPWLLHEAWPRVLRALDPHVQARCIHRIQLDTYRPELERYGERAGVAEAEAMFCADSRAVIAMLRHPRGTDEEGALRALVSMDRLLDDLGLDDLRKTRLCREQQELLLREHHADVTLKREIGARHRARRAELERAWRDPPAHVREVIPILDERSDSIRAAAARLGRAVERGEATRSPSALASSLLHLHVNRLFHFPSRTLEMVLLTFLCRTYRARLARRAPREPAP